MWSDDFLALLPQLATPLRCLAILQACTYVHGACAHFALIHSLGLVARFSAVVIDTAGDHLDHFALYYDVPKPWEFAAFSEALVDDTRFAEGALIVLTLAAVFGVRLVRKPTAFAVMLLLCVPFLPPIGKSTRGEARVRKPRAGNKPRSLPPPPPNQPSASSSTSPAGRSSSGSSPAWPSLRWY